MYRALQPLFLAAFATAVSWTASPPSLAQTAGSGTWTRCGGEGSWCTTSSLATVRFGTNGVYAQRTVSGKFGCFTTVFGDPIPGAAKGCDILSGVETATWQTCATEGQTCSASNGSVVRYGAGDRFYYRNVSGSFTCGTALFGDPFYGMSKTCQVRTGVAVAASGTLTTETTGNGGTAGAAASGTWNRCGGEGAICSVSGSTTVRFGANGLYAQRTVAGQFLCSTSVFGDPAPGATKGCDVLSGVESATWKVCATEGQICSPSGTSVVRYGSGDSWFQRTATASFNCDNGQFGDPVYGIPKVCEIRTAYGLSPVGTDPAPTASTGTSTGGTAGTGTSTGGTAGTGTGGGNSGGTAGTGTTTDSGVPSGTLALIGRQSGKCVSVKDASTAAGATIHQWTCVDVPHQNWTFVPAGNGYQIRSNTSGLCLAVQGGATGNGVPVVQQACGTQASGIWTVRKVKDWYEVVASHSGQCLNSWGATRDDGAILAQYDCSASDNELFSLSPAAQPSVWSAPKNVGLVPLTAAALPNGKVMMWASNTKTKWMGTNGGSGTYTTLYNPADDSLTPRFVTSVNHDQICPGTNVLADGRVVITGGNDQQQNTTVYDPANDSWTAGPQMNLQHNYQGATTTSTGEAMVFGGSWLNYQGNKFAELWMPGTYTWRTLKNVNGNEAAQPGVDIATGDSHFWMFAQKNGYVFKAGPTQSMHWIDTSGDGRLIPVGNRGDDTFAMNGNAVMYDVGKILTVGGAKQYLDGTPASDAAFTIDINAGPGSTPVVQRQASLAIARTFSNAVVLPSGEVVVVGGLNHAVTYSDDGSVMVPEIWSPKTGKFSRLAAMTVPRNYHSIALLLPDGRVMAAAGGLCNCSADHPDFQMLTPPYLLDASGKPANRPVITAAPSSAKLGSTLSLTTDRATTSFALVRMGATTHSVNNDQRRVPLTPTATNGTTYSFTLSSDPGTLLPGPWMLFAMDANGVPSVAKVVRIQ